LALTRAYEYALNTEGGAARDGGDDAPPAVAAAAAVAVAATTTATAASTTTTTSESEASKPMGQVAVGHTYPIGNARQVLTMTLERLNSIIDDAARIDAAAPATGERVAQHNASPMCVTDAAVATGVKKKKQQQQQRTTLREALTAAVAFGPRVTLHAIVQAQLSPKITCDQVSAEVRVHCGAISRAHSTRTGSCSVAGIDWQCRAAAGAA
jgi:hypothetical protein